MPDASNGASALDRVFGALEANDPPEQIVGRLREIEADANSAGLRARFLIARGIALNRMGFAGEALGDLHEARRLFDAAGDRANLAETWRTIALVHSWRGDGREAALALLRAIAEDTGDRGAVALALLEAGRLQIEIGRPRDAEALMRHALKIGGDDISLRERYRAETNLVQACVAARQFVAARQQIDALDLAGASPRIQHLIALENARVALGLGDIVGAKNLLGAAAPLVTAEAESFSRIEHDHVAAEIACASGDFAQAVALIGPVIARYAADDLAGREVAARLIDADALDGLHRTDAADRTLAAALRRAVARGLNGYADRVRERLAARGRSQGTWWPGSEPVPAIASAAGRFVRRRPLGAGGFGSVSRAYDLELGVEVALKRIALEAVFDPAVRADRLAAARTEVAVASQIEHPGVGRVFGLLVEPDGNALLVRELVEGPTLREIISTMHRVVDKCDLLGRVALSLAAIHEVGIVHRDLKPENIVLRNGTVPVLIDFGIALLKQYSTLDRTGTPAYAAPEQQRGRPVDARADLYALGVIAHEVLIGKLPARPAGGWRAVFGHRQRVARDIAAAGLPAGIATLVAGLLAHSPRARPAAAREVGLAFLAAARDRSTGHHADEPP